MGAQLALIIEDDYDTTVVFQEALEAAGYETEVLRSGDKALKRLVETTPGVVVLDIYLPRVAGTTILEHIRGDKRFAETHVVVVTADPTMAETLTIEEAADLVLVKPVTFHQLRDLSARLRD
jgi:DNA-binding response OmpR family regulator